MTRGQVELWWPGKYDADGERAAIPSPGATIEPIACHGDADPGRGLLVHGDNLAAMDALLRAGGPRIDLAVIDPPFATGGAFEVVTAVGEGEATIRAPAYSDRWEGGVAGFLAFLDPRLRLLHQLLADDGSLYVHLDPTVAHPVKVLLDEIFGAEGFQREIVWRIGWVSGFKSRARNWIRNHDTILYYVKDPARFTFNKSYLPYPPGYVRRDGSPPKGRGIPIDDVWNAGPGDLGRSGVDSLDSIQIKSFSREKTGWATQKNESLLRRIIEASSKPGDLVADFFAGSGTTLAVAAGLGRRFVGCDRSARAIHVARKRLREDGVPLVLARLRSPQEGEGAAEATEGALIDDQDGVETRAFGPQAVERSAILAALDDAAARGRASLRVIAQRWAFAAEAAPSRPGIELVCLHDRGDEAPIERPCLEVTWASAAPWSVEVELVGYRFSRPDLLPGALDPAAHPWHALIDAWWLAIDEEGPGEAPLRPLVERLRGRRRRALERTSGPIEAPAPRARARLVIVDVFGLATTWPFELRFEGDGALAEVIAGVEVAG
ncbi:MAG: site-specific DNA-methyltransferase [Myxococcales bacterium]|nr:site-specific DNA-methyltransferase [Myxococcales bacterium]